MKKKVEYTKSVVIGFLIGDVKISFYSFVNDSTNFNYKWMNNDGKKLIGEAYLSENNIKLEESNILYRIEK
jgi:hypothetical protein